MEQVDRNLKYSLQRKGPTWRQKLWHLSVIERLSNPVGYITLTIVAVMISLMISMIGAQPILLILGLLLGLPLVYFVIAYPKFGILTLLTGSYLIMLFAKIAIDFPVGTLMDGLEALLIIGFILKHKYDKSWEVFKNPVSLMLLIWIAYNFLEVINPEAESRMAWLFTVRTVAVVALTYFIFMYNLNNVAYIRLILKLWIALSLFAALYSFKQEYFDFFPFEKAWLANDPVAVSLYFIDNHWRKFSIFSDPVTSAYNMVISALLCITLMFGPLSKFKKALLGGFIILFVMAMLQSGTRGAFVLIPAGLILLIVLKFNRKVLLFSISIATILLFVVKMPTSNPTLIRFQSAFNPSNDASYTVRVNNQKRIQPYIQSHPFGGGLGATGTWGQRFSPNSYLSSFPPDSGYVRVAVETGWIGLILLCTLFFIVLKTGIENYLKIVDAELKTYCLAMIVIVFALNIGNFPQEALVQYPTNIFFYLIIALINITYRLDKEQFSLEPAILYKKLKLS